MRARASFVALSCIALAVPLGAAARSAGGAAPSFAPAKKYPTGTGPISVAIADLNSDGKPDLATANGTGRSISVLLNRGDGSFDPEHDYGTAKSPYTLVAADLNGDGKRDLVIANQLSLYGTSLSVLLNRGDGSFEARRDYATPDGYASNIAIADLNGDGKPDLVTANYFARTISVLLNHGDGSFEARRDYASGRGPESLAIDDLNGDGAADLTTANFDADTVSVLLNRGDGTFAARRDYATAQYPSSLSISDLNADGNPDLLFASFTGAPGGSVSVMLNRGDGTFQGRQSYGACWCFHNSQGSDVVAISIGDLNGDGKPDLATQVDYELPHEIHAGAVSVFLNKGDGTFRAQRGYRTGGVDSPPGLVISDLDGDAKPDLLTTGMGISMFLNRGDGRFLPRLDYSFPAYAGLYGSIAAGDLNGDGKPDLVTTVTGKSSVHVLINTPGLCNVQYVVGVTLAAAKRKLARVNCRVGKVARVYALYAKKGRVISQKPKFGAVLPGGGKVSLVVSRGRKR